MLTLNVLLVYSPTEISFKTLLPLFIAYMTGSQNSESVSFFDSIATRLRGYSKMGSWNG